MTKPKTRSDARPTAEELRARLDDEAEDADVLRAQVDFWSRLRTAFAANDFSSGLEALDDLALAALADDTSTPLALSIPAVLLPSPDLMSAQDPPEHALFAPASGATRSKRPSKSGKGNARAPPAKKRRTVAKHRRSWFQLPSHAPKRIKDDLANADEIAAEHDTTPERLAYPWRGQRAWFDPVEHPDLHLQLWRFVMRHRATFLILAVYAPTDDSDARRKQKPFACQARPVVLSSNIEEFGYYGFLERFENSAHDHLMWLGGKATKHSMVAKKVKDQQDSAEPPQEDLEKLLRRDPSHYERVIDRILDPARVGEEGFTSITELLTVSNALDPTRPAHLRLSTKALARIVLDVTTKDPPNPAWVGNRTIGPWKKLLSDTSLRPIHLVLSKRLRKGKSVVSYDHKPFKPAEKRDDDSDFEDDGSPVILPPTPPIDTSTPKAPRKSDPSGLFDSSDEDDDDDKSPQENQSDAEEVHSDASNDFKDPAEHEEASDDSGDELADQLRDASKKPRKGDPKKDRRRRSSSDGSDEEEHDDKTEGTVHKSGSSDNKTDDTALSKTGTNSK